MLGSIVSRVSDVMTYSLDNLDSDIKRDGHNVLEHNQT
jgi:hypothetical protein